MGRNGGGNWSWGKSGKSGKSGGGIAGRWADASNQLGDGGGTEVDGRVEGQTDETENNDRENENAKDSANREAVIGRHLSVCPWEMGRD